VIFTLFQRVQTSIRFPFDTGDETDIHGRAHRPTFFSLFLAAPSLWGNGRFDGTVATRLAQKVAFLQVAFMKRVVVKVAYLGDTFYICAPTSGEKQRCF
jgi:hypothetical protein